MKNTPGSLRTHIGIFGKRNVGKSSLLNAISGKDVSIVSPESGTTADPVRKSMNIKGLGPVIFIDTAGIDDMGSLGELRIKSARKIVEAADIGIIMVEPGGWDEFEDKLYREFVERRIPMIIAVNKTDIIPLNDDEIKKLGKINGNVLSISAISGKGIEELIAEIVRVSDEFPEEDPPMLLDLVDPGDIVVQVMPIDIEAPMGRILLPQVQGVRDVLDADAISIVVKETELKEAMEGLKHPPDLVVTDSQAFTLVNSLTPPRSRLTSYSTLFARVKGDLSAYVRGARAVDDLQDGDTLLVAEACVHHPIGNDIGRIQIPAKLQKFTGKKLNFDFVQGKGFPEDLSPYKLIIHCGACVFNRKQQLSRIREAKKQGVPISNYGVVLAHLSGILPRAIEPFFRVYPELKMEVGR